MNALLTLQLQVLQGRRKPGGWGANRPLTPEFGRSINSIPTGADYAHHTITGKSLSEDLPVIVWWA